MKIEELPDGGCIVTFEGETIRYTKEEVEEMKRDYQDALKKVNGFSGEVSKKKWMSKLQKPLMKR